MIRAAWLVVMVAVAACPAWTMAAPGDATREALQQRAEAGDAQAQVELGRALETDGVPADKVASTGWYRKAAMAGNAKGAWQLGFATMAGVGTPRDVPAGLEWLRKSVTISQNADDMATLSVVLEIDGNAQQEAMQWAQKAADKGAPKGMEVMGMARLSGHWGLPKDPALAEKLLTEAARKGDANTQLVLGQLYLNGAFGRKDPVAGMRWLQVAADSGNAKAAGLLGYFLITGKEGVPVDAARGVTLARKSMAGNGMEGHYAMGVAYVTGTGVAENPAEGWYQISLAQRMDSQKELGSAGDYLARAAAKLTPSQLTELKGRVDADAAKLPAAPAGS
ncbi:tetratricopeptide repeat protein [Dyella telluris]|uniref:Sel1 repeat family protein n=1 Tax=Dyella telluris TaxID=2763498 RepID=A0A7G8Q7D0_9GAMM|nr:tetratricopeptide repeat protein [Dyella telluris]QNK02688.1 sel1 repeat family protein [Dyella telluris]